MFSSCIVHMWDLPKYWFESGTFMKMFKLKYAYNNSHISCPSSKCSHAASLQPLPCSHPTQINGYFVIICMYLCMYIFLNIYVQPFESIYCGLCVFNFRTDHFVLDKQQGNSPLKEANSSSLSSNLLPVVFFFSSDGTPWDSLFCVSIYFDIVNWSNLV